MNYKPDNEHVYIFYIYIFVFFPRSSFLRHVSHEYLLPSSIGLTNHGARGFARKTRGNRDKQREREGGGGGESLEAHGYLQGG